MPRRGNFIRLQNHVPQRLVLSSLGVIKNGFYGPQKLFNLEDGRSIYLDLEIANRVETNCEVGKEFWLCKHSGARGQKTTWDIYHEDPTPQPEESKLERDLRLSIEEARRIRRVVPVSIAQAVATSAPPAIDDYGSSAESTPEALAEPANAPAVTQEVLRKAPAWAETLVDQTNELVDAYASCLKHASHHDLAVKPEDVRTLLVTAFIGLSQRGKTRNNAA